MKIREAYSETLRREGHVEDPAQLEIVEQLEVLQAQLTRSPLRFTRLRSLFGRAANPGQAPVPGLYLWGGVGRGKTLLMDLFFETLPIRAKKRIHFHRMMREVHERLKALGNVRDPLDGVAADIARSTRVLCFDEFFVSDIGDAMILGRLLDGLFERGVTLVATSNSKPDDLYKDGLQRQRFLPAIDLLNQHTRVVQLESGVDYRLRLLEKAGTYLCPDDEDALQRLSFFFDESATSEIRENTTIDINAREIPAQKCAKSIIWFGFEDICDGPRSQADYIEIARWYPTVIIAGVPQFDATLENQARRFIALVDEFYDRHVKLMLSADVELNSLYRGGKLTFEFERTTSRLIEMQSREYLALPHLS